MAYSIGNVSGCHINPAVSVGVLLTGGMTVTDFISYLAAQFLGAIVGAACLRGLIGTSMGLGCNGLYDGSVLKSIVIEVILTCIFVLAVLGATSKAENGRVAGLVIGGSLTLVHLLGIFFTGTSVNPARSFGPALLLGGQSLACVWVFIVAPMIGGVIAALIWNFLKPEN
jgi:aquaporin Z